MLDPKVPVVILCGGKGSRLKEETEYRPKPMMMIGDRPVLWHIMKLYSHYGARRFILCLGYKKEMIVDYFLNYKNYNSPTTISLKDQKVSHDISQDAAEDWDIQLIDTGLSTMTGGRIKRIEKFIDTDYFLMTYGDGVANINLDDLIKFHQNKKRTATLTAIHPPSRFGVLQEGPGDSVGSFHEKPPMDSGYVNGGFFVLNKDIFKYLKNDATVFEEEPLRTLATDNQLSMFKHEGRWRCMDTYKDYEEMNASWDNDPFWKLW